MNDNLQFFHTAASTPPCMPLGTPRRRFFALCQIAAFSLMVLKYASYNYTITGGNYNA